MWIGVEAWLRGSDRGKILAAFCYRFEDYSELQFCRELDRALAADLIPRIEAAIGPAGAEAIRQRLCRLPEERRVETVVGGPKLG